MAIEYPFGYAAAETLLYHLENYGIALVAGTAAFYTLHQLEDALKKSAQRRSRPAGRPS